MKAILEIFAYIGYFVLGYCLAKNPNTPTAIDVYQGKTTLEITYRDSIPIDTVVVFKPEFNMN